MRQDDPAKCTRQVHCRRGPDSPHRRQVGNPVGKAQSRPLRGTPGTAGPACHHYPRLAEGVPIPLFRHHFKEEELSARFWRQFAEILLRLRSPFVNSCLADHDHRSGNAFIVGPAIGKGNHRAQWIRDVGGQDDITLFCQNLLSGSRFFHSLPRTRYQFDCPVSVLTTANRLIFADLEL